MYATQKIRTPLEEWSPHTNMCSPKKMPIELNNLTIVGSIYIYLLFGKE